MSTAAVPWGQPVGRLLPSSACPNGDGGGRSARQAKRNEAVYVRGPMGPSEGNAPPGRHGKVAPATAAM